MIIRILPMLRIVIQPIDVLFEAFKNKGIFHESTAIKTTA